MSFEKVLSLYDFDDLSKDINSKTEKDVEIALGKGTINEDDFMALLSPIAKKHIEELALRSHEITLRRFGRTIKVYAPIYLSNHCVNSCVYCGFNRATDINRITLSESEIKNEIDIVANSGIRNVILVSGDNCKKFSDEDLANSIRLAKNRFPFVSIEVRALPTEIYAMLHEAGADGFTMFQETYSRNSYPEFHPRGPKADFQFRLDAPERAAIGGMREIGLGALLGLCDFRVDLFLMSLHAKYLSSKYWKSHVSASFPRLRSSHGGFQAKYDVSDIDVMQCIFAFRLFLNDAGVNISTRESALFRDRILPLGATLMSAGSKTEPGGYAKHDDDAVQFKIDDERSVAQFVNDIKALGYETVMKDWY